MRRIGLAVALAAGLAGTLLAALPPAEPDPPSPVRRPNVVLIVSDYMGYGDIGPYGVPDTRTPSLDRLAREGVRLTDAYASAPVCTPSRAALLTGRYQQRAGLEQLVSPERPEVGLPASEATVGRMLKDTGYATGVFGKWHLGFAPESGPNAHGFDEFFGFLDWSIDYYSHRTFSGKPGLYENGTPVEREGYSTDLFTDRGVSFIERHSQEPFLLYMAYNAALPPAQPPHRPTDLRTRETWDASTREDYVQVVEALDAGIGRILGALDRAGVAPDTLVIFTYDHGGRELSRKEPLFHGFATLWEGGIRVPCLIRWRRRLPAGRVSHQLAISMDLTASILSAAGVKPPPGRALDGIDLIPVLEGKMPGPERTFFWRFDASFRKQKAVRQGRWKYMRDGNTDLLFDVEHDLGEREDLVYKNPPVVRQLRTLLQEWEAQMGPPSRP